MSLVFNFNSGPNVHAKLIMQKQKNTTRASASETEGEKNLIVAEMTSDDWPQTKPSNY